MKCGHIITICKYDLCSEVKNREGINSGESLGRNWLKIWKISQIEI